MEHLAPIFSPVVKRQIKEELIEELGASTHYVTTPRKTEVENNTAYVIDLQQEKVFFGDHDLASRVIIKQEDFIEEEENIDEGFIPYDSIDYSIVKQEKEQFLEEPPVDQGLQSKQGILSKSPNSNGVINTTKDTSPTSKEVKPSIDESSTPITIAGPAHNKKKIHQCLECHYKTVRPDHLIRHQRALHLKAKPYKKCSLCTFKSVEETSLKKHVMSKHPLEKPYQCPKCQYKTKSERVMNRHMKSRHQKSNLHYCSKCGFKTDKFQDLEKHVADIHTKAKEASHKCLDCSFIAQSSQELKNHIKALHKVQKCLFCDYQTTEPRDISKHISSAHAKDKLYICSQCDFRAPDMSKLKRHTLVKHPLEKPYQCPNCDFKTASERDMKRHAEAQHPHQCEKCNFKTGDYQDLEKHIAEFHSDDESDRSDDSECESHRTEETQKCLTSSNQKVKRQDRSVLDSKTSTSGDVSKQTKTNIKDKPFQCPLCKFLSVEAAVLKRHMVAKHPLEKPYSCPDCNFKAENERTIERHIKGVHSKKNECSDSKSSIEHSQELKKLSSAPKNKVSEVETNKLVGDLDHCECIHCDFKTTNPIHLKRHMKAIHAKENPYQCSQCGFSAPEAIILKNHVMSNHPKLTTYQCPDCSYETTSVFEMNKHTTTLHPDDLEETSDIHSIESCASDGDMIQTIDEIENLLKTQQSTKLPNSVDSEPCVSNDHSIVTTYQCEHCEYNTKNSYHFVRHNSAVHKKEKSLKCQECEFSTAQQIHLKRHRMAKHSFGKPFHCSECHFITANERNLKRHREGQHSPADITQNGKKCKLKLSSISDLKKRLVDFHSDKEVYSCPDCEFVTNYSRELKSHIKTLHSKEKLRCSQCEYTTLNPDDLDNHALSIHKISLKQNIKVRNTKNKVYNIKKPIGKPRAPSDALKEAFPVNIKGKKKTSNGTKIKVKSFECGHCDYKTDYSRHLRRHLVTIHKEEKPFVCPMCRFTSVELRCLQNHVLLKHL